MYRRRWFVEPLHAVSEWLTSDKLLLALDFDRDGWKLDQCTFLCSERAVGCGSSIQMGLGPLWSKLVQFPTVKHLVKHKTSVLSMTSAILSVPAHTVAGDTLSLNNLILRARDYGFVLEKSGQNCFRIDSINANKLRNVFYRTESPEPGRFRHILSCRTLFGCFELINLSLKASSTV